MVDPLEQIVVHSISRFGFQPWVPGGLELSSLKEVRYEAENSPQKRTMAAEGGQVTPPPVELFIYWLGSGLVASVPFALLLGRLRGLDIRTLGSGNVGATNLARSAGLGWGVLAFLLDAGKGFAPVMVGQGLGFERWIPVVAGGVAVIGHCYSPYLRFRGGKGVATAAGVLAALDYRLFLGLLLFWGALLAVFRNVGMASTLAALGAMGVGLWLLWNGGLLPGERGESAVAGFLLVFSTLVVVRHRKNVAAYLRPRGEAQP